MAQKFIAPVLDFELLGIVMVHHKFLYYHHFDSANKLIVSFNFHLCLFAFHTDSPPPYKTKVQKHITEMKFSV